MKSATRSRGAKGVPTREARFRTGSDGPAPAGSQGVFIETYGCQMNEYDSGIALRYLTDQGFHRVSVPDEASVILLNTCAVRENAHQKVYGRLQSFSGLKRRRKDLVVGLLGCMAQNLGEDLFAMGLPLDMIVGPDNLRELPALVEHARSRPGQVVQRTRLSVHETYDDVEPGVVSGAQAFVTIMRGCDNFCTFCVVPYTRGRERSREPASIVAEIERLIEQGVREVTLLGQNVNSYRSEDADFARLVALILERTTLERIRFTSPHPHDFPRHLLELMAREERFCSSIHLPMQSGSDRVLAAMRRDYTRDTFRGLVEEIRSVVGDVGLTTDVIVGFPGETEADFEDTLSLVAESGFDLAYMFRYSPRENTYAIKHLPDDVPEEVKLERLNRLIALQRSASAERNKSEVGRTHRVLVEGPSRRSAVELMGRSLTGKVVIFPLSNSPESETAPDTRVPPEATQWHEVPVGQTFSVRVESVTSATLRGRIVP